MYDLVGTRDKNYNFSIRKTIIAHWLILAADAARIFSSGAITSNDVTVVLDPGESDNDTDLDEGVAQTYRNSEFLNTVFLQGALCCACCRSIAVTNFVIIVTWPIKGDCCFLNRYQTF